MELSFIEKHYHETRVDKEIEELKHKFKELKAHKRNLENKKYFGQVADEKTERMTRTTEVKNNGHYLNLFQPIYLILMIITLIAIVLTTNYLGVDKFVDS